MRERKKSMDSLTVFTARKIHTMDAGRPTATAIAISGERIVSVGTLDSMSPWLDRLAHKIDDRFADNVLMPGFIDPHTHLRMSGIFMGLNYVGPIESYGRQGRLPSCESREDVLARLRKLVEEAGDSDAPILAWGYDPAIHGGHLDRDVLDEISDRVPIWVVCYAPHIVYTNTPMLGLTGVSEADNTHGLGRYSDGRLNGWFVESAAVGKALAAVQKDIFRPGIGIEALRLQAKVAVANGVTTVGDMGWGMGSNLETEWSDHLTLAQDASFPLRVSLTAFEPILNRTHGADRFKFIEEKIRQSTSRLNAHGLKWINDGSYPAMTLLLGFPGYLDEDHGLSGETPWEDMVESMLPYWERGYQIHSHANGDATIDMTLDTLAALQAKHPRFDHRFTIEHYTISTTSQARRLAALGGTASVNPYFVHFRGLLHSQHGFGPDRSEATARLGSLESAGAHFCIHSDYNLVVAPMAPLLGAWIAVNRLAEDGKTVMAPGERISLERALRAITIDAAFTLRRDHDLGSLEVGKLADMAILGEDPLEVGAEGLKDISVLGTISGGVVHVAGD